MIGGLGSELRMGSSGCVKDVTGLWGFMINQSSVTSMNSLAISEEKDNKEV